MVEVVERDHEPDVVLADELGDRVDVTRVGDERHEHPAVGVVERGRQLVGVRGERDRARCPNARTMSTRCPAQVKRTTVTVAGNGVVAH